MIERDGQTRERIAALETEVAALTASLRKVNRLAVVNGDTLSLHLRMQTLLWIAVCTTPHDWENHCNPR